MNFLNTQVQRRRVSCRPRIAPILWSPWQMAGELSRGGAGFGPKEVTSWAEGEFWPRGNFSRGLASQIYYSASRVSRTKFGYFFFAELAFMLMMLKENVRDLLHISEAQIILDPATP